LPYNTNDYRVDFTLKLERGAPLTGSINFLNRVVLREYNPNTQGAATTLEATFILPGVYSRTVTKPVSGTRGFFVVSEREITGPYFEPFGVFLFNMTDISIYSRIIYHPHLFFPESGCRNWEGNLHSGSHEYNRPQFKICNVRVVRGNYGEDGKKVTENTEIGISTGFYVFLSAASETVITNHYSKD
jgi:hypothetical protein